MFLASCTKSVSSSVAGLQWTGGKRMNLNSGVESADAFRKANVSR